MRLTPRLRIPGIGHPFGRRSRSDRRRPLHERLRSYGRSVAALAVTALAGAGLGAALPVAAPPAAAQPPSSVALVGSLQDELGCGADWDPACASTALTDPDGDGTWSYTATVPAGSYELKVALNGTWDLSYGKNGAVNGENIPLVLGADSALTFTWNATTHRIGLSSDALTGDYTAADDALVAAPVRQGTNEQFYFVLTDRFANGDSSNDTGGLSGDATVTGLDPSDKGFYHGGDIQGIIDRLDYIQSLGTTAVWLTPSFTNRPVQGEGENASAGYHGYWITDFTSIDPHLGGNEALGELRDALHERGMKLYLDIVTNHTADLIDYQEGAYSYVETSAVPYTDAAGNPVDISAAANKPGFPTFDATSSFPYTPVRRGDVIPEALNDITLYHNRGDSTWAGESVTMGDFVGLDDLMTENPVVEQTFEEVYTAWLDRGVDGFRMDVISLISKTYPLADGVVGPGALYADPFGTANGPRVHEFLSQMHREVIAPRHRHILTVGETAGVTLAEAQRYTDPGSPELDMVFQFEHVGLDAGPGGKFDPRPLDLVELKRNLARWQDGLAPIEGVERGWNSSFWDNHDQPRAVSRFGDDDPAWRELSAKTLASTLHMHRGTPYIYQGEELGQTNTVFGGIEDYRDLESINYVHERVGLGESPKDVLARIAPISRDNARTPVQWDGGEHAGFTTGTPWIPVAPNAREINAAAQIDAPGSVLEHYRALIALRHSDDVVALGTFRLLADDDPAAWVILRQGGGSGGSDRAQLLLLANWGREDLDLSEDSALRRRLAEQGVDLERWSGAERVLMASAPGAPASRGTGAPDALKGWDSVILRLRPGR